MSCISGVIKGEKNSAYSFQNFGQEGQKEGERGGGRKEEGEEDPVVSVEYPVILRVREHVPKEVSRDGTWRTSESMTSSRTGGRCGRMDGNSVEIREVEGEPEVVLVS